MNPNDFHAIDYFLKNYFDSGLDWYDLGEMTDYFFMHEHDDGIVKSFQREIATLYTRLSDGTLTQKEAAYILGAPIKKAGNLVQMLYEKSAGNKNFRTICHFLYDYIGCRADLSTLENAIENFLAPENIRALENKIQTMYPPLNAPALMKDVSADVTYIKNCIHNFQVRECNEKTNAFRKEIEAVYTLVGNPALIKEAAHRFGGDIKTTDMKAVSVIKLICDTSAIK
ncbi:MAG: BCIP domain-containing protein [Butyrivibrio sp.]|nr:BCIP domain-containing protein [Muribaculum sp.]MCM1553459.1 BCIP domain-containing protein [Butyrivibrio sp.]